MKAVMLSIQPHWCELIASGKKTLEIRKTQPKMKPPFKCFIYCTKDMKGWFDFCKKQRLDGMVIGEFICDRIRPFDVPYPAFQSQMDKWILKQSCHTYYQMHRYAYHDCLFAWHISNLVIYDMPKQLGDFKQCHKCEYYEKCCEHEYSCDGVYNLTRPPQSWCYVEEV